MTFMRVVPLNFHDAATLSTSLAPVTDFPAEDTQNSIRSKGWRSPDLTTQYIAGTLDADRTATHFSLFRHTCAGANVRLQLYSDAAWTTQVYDSTTVAVRNVTATDPYDWGVDPLGIGQNDPFVTEAPFWLWFAATTFRSYKVTFSGTPLASAYFQVSRIWLGRYFELARQPIFGASIGPVDQTDRNRSIGGSLRTNLGAVWRTMTLDLSGVNEDERATWGKLGRYLGTGRDFVLSLYPGDGTEKERDHTLNVKFLALDPILRNTAVYSKRLQLEEC